MYIYKYIDTYIWSMCPCLFPSNALLQVGQPTFVKEEYFNTAVSVYISYITISLFATCTHPI